MDPVEPGGEAQRWQQVSHCRGKAENGQHNTAGGAEKCRYLTKECGFDAAIDYKAGPLGRGLSEHCRAGVDVVFLIW